MAGRQHALHGTFAASRTPVCVSRLWLSTPFSFLLFLLHHAFVFEFRCRCRCFKSQWTHKVVQTSVGIRVINFLCERTKAKVGPRPASGGFAGGIAA